MPACIHYADVVHLLVCTLDCSRVVLPRWHNNNDDVDHDSNGRHVRCMGLKACLASPACADHLDQGCIMFNPWTSERQGNVSVAYTICNSLCYACRHAAYTSHTYLLTGMPPGKKLAKLIGKHFALHN